MKITKEGNFVVQALVENQDLSVLGADANAKMVLKKVAGIETAYLKGTVVLNSTMNVVFPTPTFTRASVAYLPDGTSVTSGVPRYVDGRFGGSGKGVLIEEGTVNLLTANHSNGGEDGTIGNVGTVTATATSDATKAHFGTRSFKVVTSATGTSGTYFLGGYGGVGGRISVTSGQTYTYTFYVQNLSGTRSIHASLEWYDAGNAHLTTAISTDVVMVTGAWTKITLTATAPTNAVATTPCAYTTIGAIGDSWFVDTFQLEQKAYATSWVLGGSTRNAETLTVPTTGMSPTAWTWEQWVYVNNSARRQVAGQYPNVFNIARSVTAGTGNGIVLYHVSNSANWNFEIRNDSDIGASVTIADSYTSDGWHLFSATGSSTAAKLYIDGVLRGTINSPPLPSGFASTADIGRAGPSYLNTLHDSIRVSNVERTATEVLAYYNSIKSPVPDQFTQVLLNFDGTLLSHEEVKAVLMPNGNLHIRGTKIIG